MTTDTKDTMMEISCEDYKHWQNMLTGTNLENKELHKIIKRILEIEGDRNYVPEAYELKYNELVLKRRRTSWQDLPVYNREKDVAETKELANRYRFNRKKDENDN